MSSLVRLNKALAEAGITSRRKADRMIEMGLVQVNGKKVYELGIRVNPSKDRIVVDGHPVTFLHKKVYIMFHKPTQVLTTLNDPEGRPTVIDYFNKYPVRIFPIGRLDWDSEGLLLLTNDGDFANEVMHPRGEVTKTYLVKINGQPDKSEIEKLTKGVSIVGGKAKARHIEKIKRPSSSEQYDWYKVVISEGKNRQIRQMFEKIGYDVMKLQRVSIGRLKLGALPRGEWTELSEEQTKRIFVPDLPEELMGRKPATANAQQAKDQKTAPRKPQQKRKASIKKTYQEGPKKSASRIYGLIGILREQKEKDLGKTQVFFVLWLPLLMALRGHASTAKMAARLRFSGIDVDIFISLNDFSFHISFYSCSYAFTVYSFDSEGLVSL